MAASTIILQGGTVLTHGGHDQVTAVTADVLIQGNKIVKIGPNIEVAEGVTIVDVSSLWVEGFSFDHSGLSGRR